MPGFRSTIAAGLSLAVLVACASNPSEPLPVQLSAPASATMGVGVSRTLVTGVDEGGRTVSLRGVTLTSSNPAVAEVRGSGVVTSKSLGAATITARTAGVTVETQVWVVPAAINACETNTATLCSTWTLADSLYNAVWRQGSRAVITVGHFSADSVRFNRVDPSGTSQGMRVVYWGSVTGRSVQTGVVTWTPAGSSSFSGAWDGDW